MKVFSGIREKNTLRIKGRFLERECPANTFQSPSSFFNHINSWKKFNERKTGKRNLLKMPLIFMPTYTVKLLINWGFMTNAKLIRKRSWDIFIFIVYFKLDAIAENMGPYFLWEKERRTMLFFLGQCFLDEI